RLQAAPTLVPPTHALAEAQLASLEQPVNVAFGPQNCSDGPPAHSPSLPAAQVPPGHSEAELQLAFWFVPPTHVLVGEHTPSAHWLNKVACPGKPHEPPGHCVPNAMPWHGAPGFELPMQRAPLELPQIPSVVEQRPPVHTPLGHSVPAPHGFPEQVPPPAHSDATVHAAPAFVPPAQRPDTGQSALLEQD